MKIAKDNGMTPEQIEVINARFCAERDQYDLRYRCQDCLHFSEPEDRCSLGFLKSHFGDGPHRCRTDNGDLVFCKYFEVE